MVSFTDKVVIDRARQEIRWVGEWVSEWVGLNVHINTLSVISETSLSSQSLDVCNYFSNSVQLPHIPENAVLESKKLFSRFSGVSWKICKTDTEKPCEQSWKISQWISFYVVSLWTCTCFSGTLYISYPPACQTSMALGVTYDVRRYY